MYTPSGDPTLHATRPGPVGPGKGEQGGGGAVWGVHVWTRPLDRLVAHYHPCVHTRYICRQLCWLSDVAGYDTGGSEATGGMLFYTFEKRYSHVLHSAGFPAVSGLLAQKP